MAFEASRNIFNNAENELLRAVGASEEKLEELERELGGFQEKRDWKKVAETAEKLRTLSELRSDILGVANPFNEILGKYVEVGLLAPKSVEIASPQERKHRNRNPEKYIDNASANIGLAIIQKKSDKGFEFGDLRDVGIYILQESQKNDRDAISGARNYAYVEVIHTSEKILGTAIQTGAKTMSKLIEKAVPTNIPNKLWSQFYTNVGKDYGQMTPIDFVTKIFLRLHPEGKIKELTKDVIKEISEKKKRPPTKFGPGDMTPLEELVLCNRIATDETYTKLTEVFDGQSPIDLATSHGYPCLSSSLAECLMASREKMAKLRDNKQIDAKEGVDATRKVQRAINIMSRDRRGWHKLNPDYKALQFIYSLLVEVGHNQSKLQDLMDAIFPEKTYTVDARNSFFIMPGIGGKEK